MFAACRGLECLVPPGLRGKLQEGSTTTATVTEGQAAAGECGAEHTSSLLCDASS